MVHLRNNTSQLFSRYTANLAAHLTANWMKGEYQSLVDVHESGRPVYIYGSANVEAYYQRRFPKAFNDSLNMGTFWKYEAEALSLLKNGSMVLGHKTLFENFTRTQCNLKLTIINDFGIRLNGFALKKNHWLLHEISEQLLIMLSDGRITEIIEYYANKFQKCNKESSLMTQLPYAGLDNMAG